MAVLVSTKGRWYAGAETRVHVRLESPTEIAVDIFEKGKGGEHVTSDSYPATAAGVREVNEVLKGEGVRQTVALPRGAGERPSGYCGVCDRKFKDFEAHLESEAHKMRARMPRFPTSRRSEEISDIETFISGPHRFAGMGDICTKCGKPEESWVHAKGARELISRVSDVRLTIK